MFDVLYCKSHSLHKSKAEIKKLNAEVNEMEKVIEDLEFNLINQLEEQSLPGAQGTLGSVSWKTEVMPKVKDWDKVWKHCLDTQSFEIIGYHRVLPTVFREKLSQGEMIDGVESFTKKKLNFRTK